MRLIRFILIDLALVLLAPESATATIMATRAHFKTAPEAVGYLRPTLYPEPVSSPDVIRHLYRHTSQAAPFEHSAEALGPLSRLTTSLRKAAYLLVGRARDSGRLPGP